MTRDVYWPRAGANEVMIATWGTDRGLVPMVDPVYQFPFDERSWMGPSFGTWYKTGGQKGEEPPAELQELMALYDEYKGTVDSAHQLGIARQIVRLATERLYVIGTVGHGTFHRGGEEQLQERDAGVHRRLADHVAGNAGPEPLLLRRRVVATSGSRGGRQRAPTTSAGVAPDAVPASGAVSAAALSPRLR